MFLKQRNVENKWNKTRCLGEQRCLLVYFSTAASAHRPLRSGPVQILQKWWVDPFKLPVLVVRMERWAIQSVPFHRTKHKREGLAQRLVKPHLTGQRPSVKPRKWDGQAAFSVPTFTTVWDLNSREKINRKKNTLKQRLRGQSSLSNCTNLTQFICGSRLTLVFTPVRMGKRRHTQHAKTRPRVPNNK